ITRGRIRGATLVAMPAFSEARIVLDPADQQQERGGYDLAASAGATALQRVVSYVSTAPAPVGAREVAAALGISMASARGHLARAVEAGYLVRLARGAYVAAATLPEQGELTASASGDLELPVHEDRDATWDGDAAASRVLEWAAEGSDDVDPERLGAAFLWRDDDADPATLAAYKLGFADVIDGQLRIIPGGVFAAASVLQGGRGGVDIPDSDRNQVRDRVERLYDRLAEALDDPGLRAPWDDADDDLEASAWTAMREADPMPAAWFREPTPEELPPGSGGVHYDGGRVYGWVAQAGEPHAGYPGKNLTIESLGAIDLTHFLRAKFTLDDGSVVRAGAMTMNVGHHRDGAECETAACQFDDTRTVGAIITVGINERGMWFSGAAAPWLDPWDKAVFQACQPSYHMRKGRDGRWQLRAVLTVPVPGHSSPLLAAAVELANVELAASAAQAQARADWPETGETPAALTPLEALASGLIHQTSFVDDLLAAMERREQQRRAELARLAEQIAPAREELAASAAVSNTGGQ
ncbi:MAG TPA: type IV toxin-antitoxin system AbiEi family antitoxin domain-containing protein, partial [Streptomyces sp.]|nr:type IV toxin-antitoxin system AbiEi family antitoxin domain-containing protein [Streptomyces sp.]